MSGSAYQQMRARQIATVEGQDQAAAESRERAEERALRRLRASTTSARREVLRDTVTRMSNDDLDTAWIAALRGDLETVHERFKVHVREKRRGRDSSGTPWRQSGWLGKPKT